MYKIINVFKNDDLIHTLLSIDDKILNLGMSVEEYLKQLGVVDTETPYLQTKDSMSGFDLNIYKVKDIPSRRVHVHHCVEVSKEDPKTKRIQKAIFENFNPKIGMALKKGEMFNSAYKWRGDTLYKCGENGVGEWVEDPICNLEEWLETGGYHFVTNVTKKDSFISFGDEIEIKELLKDYKGSTYHKSGKFLLIEHPIHDTFYLYATRKENPENLAVKQAVYMNTQNALGFAIWENDMYGSGYYTSDDILFQNINSRSHFICTKDEWLEAGGVVSKGKLVRNKDIIYLDNRGQLYLNDFLNKSERVGRNLVVNEAFGSLAAIQHHKENDFDQFEILEAKDPKFFTKLFGNK